MLTCLALCRSSSLRHSLQPHPIMSQSRTAKEAACRHHLTPSSITRHRSLLLLYLTGCPTRCPTPLQGRYRWVAILDYDEWLVPKMAPGMKYTKFLQQVGPLGGFKWAWILLRHTHGTSSSPLVIVGTVTGYRSRQVFLKLACFTAEHRCLAGLNCSNCMCPCVLRRRNQTDKLATCCG